MTLYKELSEMRRKACGNLVHQPEVATNMYVALLKRCGTNKLLAACMFDGETLHDYAMQLFETKSDIGKDIRKRSQFVVSDEFRNLVHCSPRYWYTGEEVDVNATRVTCSSNVAALLGGVLLLVSFAAAFAFTPLASGLDEIGRISGLILAELPTEHAVIGWVSILGVLWGLLFAWLTACRLIVLWLSVFFCERRRCEVAEQVVLEARKLDELIALIRSKT